MGSTTSYHTYNWNSPMFLNYRICVSSVDTKHVTVALNDTCRIITVCLRPTTTYKLYLLAGIAPPEIRRNVPTNIDKTKQIKDERHPMFGHEIMSTRLNSR